MKKWLVKITLLVSVLIIMTAPVFADTLADRLVTKGHVFDPELAEAMRPLIVGTEAVVSTGNVQASLVGYDIIKKGGNAFDAGVAAAAALKVTKMHYAGWCGITPFIGYSAKEDKVAAYAGVGTAPKAATLDFFLDKGHLIMPTDEKFLTALTPSEPDSFIAILQRWGTMSFTEVIQGALELAERGFPAYKYHVDTCKKADPEALFPYNKEYWLQYGRAPKPGELIVNKDLGKTFRIMIDAEQKALKEGKNRNEALEAARDAFYKGEIAHAVADFFQANGGLMTYEDLANYHGKWYDPVKTTYKDYEVYATPTWTQAGLLVQYLNMLENYDLKAMGYSSPAYLHLLTQIIDLGMADRWKYYGDPDFVEVPDALWSKEYARERIKLIDMNKAFTEMPSPGDPKNMKATLAEADLSEALMVAKADVDPDVEIDTTYLCVIDKEGNIFSMTPSDGHVSSPMVPGYGFGLATRMTQFTLDPELASVVAPGKRPMVTPNPILGFKDGKPYFALGTPGGDMQPQTMIQVLLNHIEWGMDPQQALDQPRVGTYNYIGAFSPYPYYPGRMNLEGRYPKEVGDALAAMGHKVVWWPDWTVTAGSSCFIVKDTETGLIIGGADVRRESYAVGW